MTRPTTRPTTRQPHPCSDPGSASGEEGSVALELAILAPVLLVLLGFIVYVGRLSDAHSTLEGASHDAARAASLARTANAADTAARSTAQSSLQQDGLHCTSTTVSIDDHGFTQPIGTPAAVTVTVSCREDLSDLGLPGLPGSKTLTATFTSPLDPYRAKAQS